MGKMKLGSEKRTAAGSILTPKSPEAKIIVQEKIVEVPVEKIVEKIVEKEVIKREPRNSNPPKRDWDVDSLNEKIEKNSKACSERSAWTKGQLSKQYKDYDDRIKQLEAYVNTKGEELSDSMEGISEVVSIMHSGYDSALKEMQESNDKIVATLHKQREADTKIYKYTVIGLSILAVLGWFL